MAYLAGHYIIFSGSEGRQLCGQEERGEAGGLEEREAVVKCVVKDLANELYKELLDGFHRRA